MYIRIYSLVCYSGEQLQLLTNNEKGTLYPSDSRNVELVSMTGFYVGYVYRAEWSLYTVLLLIV